MMVDSQRAVLVALLRHDLRRRIREAGRRIVDEHPVALELLANHDPERP